MVIINLFCPYHEFKTKTVAILNYYRVHKLHMPEDICPIGFQDELNFWGIGKSHTNSIRCKDALTDIISVIF